MNFVFIPRSMDKNSISESHFLRLFETSCREGKIPRKYEAIVLQFYTSYTHALRSQKQEIDPYLNLFSTFLQLVLQQFQSPFLFEPYHKKIRHPFDYYRFGIEFIRPLVHKQRSTARYLTAAEQMEKQLYAGENVVLLANHQTEPDPQAISLLLEDHHPALAEQIIYIAGERVVTDPLAIPFSMGCDLLCIYSKRYIDFPAEQKADKLRHNQRTMEQMRHLFQEGGKIVYVAPTGGRDRKNQQGLVEIAPFDPQSLEMIYLTASRAQTPTHFYPLTLATYELFPPPDTIQKELGEKRLVNYTPIHLAFGEEFDMDRFPGAEGKDKREKRALRAELLWNIVHTNYQTLVSAP